MVKYSYDAWGKPADLSNEFISTYTEDCAGVYLGEDNLYLSSDGAEKKYLTAEIISTIYNKTMEANEIGALNPIRYRGYYYDAETGLYFLGSRYYDPEVGRFINADDISYLDPTEINGLNLYSYCGNNPIMYYDPTGHFPILIALILGGFAIAGGIIGGKVAYDNAVSAGKSGSDLFWSTVGGVFVGASAGLAVGGLIVATGGAIYGAIHGISAIVPFVGLTALKTFAIGALAFNQFAFITAPILGITMDGIETVPDGDKTKVPKPGETPKHPYGRIGFQSLLPFNRNVSRYYKILGRSLAFRNLTLI